MHLLSDALSKVKEAEQKAEQIILDGKNKSDDLLKKLAAEADTRYEEILSSGRKKAEELLSTAEKTGDEKADEIISSASSSISKYKVSDEAVDELVKGIVERIVV